MGGGSRLRRRLKTLSWDHMNAGGKGQFLATPGRGRDATKYGRVERETNRKVKIVREDQSAAFDAPMEDFLVCVLRCEEIDYLNLGTLEEEKLDLRFTKKASYDLRKDGVCVPVVSSVKNA